MMLIVCGLSINYYRCTPSRNLDSPVSTSRMTHKLQSKLKSSDQAGGGEREIPFYSYMLCNTIIL